VVADDTGFAILTTLQAGELLGFAVKLLNFRAQATRLLCGLRVILSQVVGDEERLHVRFTPVSRRFNRLRVHMSIVNPLFRKGNTPYDTKS
jgi:hypothetical protein